MVRSCCIVFYLFHVFFHFLFLFLLLEEQQRGDHTGNGSAEVSLPADPRRKGGQHITDHSHKGIQHIQELFPGDQVVYQVRCHQAPDGTAGTGMEAAAANEVDQQCGSQHGSNVDQQVFPFTDPVLKHKAEYGQAVHVAEEMRNVKMQETAQEQPLEFSSLESSLDHAEMPENVILSSGQFIDSCYRVQDDQDQGDPRDRDLESADPDGSFLFPGFPVKQITGILPAVGADLGSFFQRHTALLAVDDD